MSGADLQSLGVPAGPSLSRGLQLIRAAKLDGWAPDLADEQAIALRFAKSIRDSERRTPTWNFTSMATDTGNATVQRLRRAGRSVDARRVQLVRRGAST